MPLSPGLLPAAEKAGGAVRTALRPFIGWFYVRVHASAEIGRQKRAAGYGFKALLQMGQREGLGHEIKHHAAILLRILPKSLPGFFHNFPVIKGNHLFRQGVPLFFRKPPGFLGVRAGVNPVLLPVQKR